MESPNPRLTNERRWELQIEEARAQARHLHDRLQRALYDDAFTQEEVAKLAARYARQLIRLSSMIRLVLQPQLR